jgi:hypothetical protein
VPGLTARATVLTSSATARHAVGDRVRIGFDRADARVLPEDVACS